MENFLHDKKSIFIVLCFLLLVSVLFGCTSRTATSDLRATNNKETNTVEDNLYQQEYVDVINKAKENNIKTNSNHFSLTLDIEKKDDKDIPYIVYRTALHDPQSEMFDVKISFTLQLQMQNRLNTPTIFYTSVNDKRVVNLDPVKVNKYQVFLALPLNGAKIDRDFLNNYKKIIVKTTWKSKDGSLHQDYIAAEGIPSSDIQSYLDKIKK